MDARKKCQVWMINLLKLYILLMVFVVPQQYTSYVIWGSGLLILSLYLYCCILSSKLYGINKKILVLWMIILLVVLINIFFSDYPTDKLILSVFQLFLISLFASEDAFKINERFDWFYVFSTIFLVCNICIDYFSNKILVFTNFADKNYAAIIVFLYCLYSLKKRYILGLLVSFAYILVSSTRLYILALILCALSILVAKSKFLQKHAQNSMTVRNTMLLFISMFILTVAVSYVWSYYVVGENTTSYQESINDTSNAIRTNSNLYAFRVLESDRDLLWRGYDSKIRDALGVGSDILTEHVSYLGLRIVQPHNSIINSLITHGVLYTILYYMMLSNILSKFFKPTNIMLWVPYLVITLVMHSMLSSFFLVFWVMVLVAPSREKKGKVKVRRGNY